VPKTIDGGAKNDVKEAQHYWEIKLCWSEFRDGKWQPKQITTDCVESNSMAVATSPTDRFAPPKKHLFRAYVTTEGNLAVNVYGQIDKYTDSLNFIGRFLFDTSGTVSVGYRAGMYKITPNNPPQHRIEGMTTTWEYPAQLADQDADSGWDRNMWKGAGDQNTRKLGLAFDLAASDSVTVFLDRSPSSYRLLLPHQYIPINPPGYTPMKINGTYQFFFQDGQRTYFVLPAYRKDDPPKVIAKPDVSKILIEVFPQLDPGGPVYDWHGEEIDPFGGIQSGGIDIDGITIGGRGAMANLPKKTARKASLIMRLDAEGSDDDPEDAGQGPAEPPDTGKEPPKPSTPAKQPPAVPQKSYEWTYSSPFNNGYNNQLQFFTHYNPHVTSFIRALNRYGVVGLLTADNQLLKTDTTFGDRYKPNQQGSQNVVKPYPTGGVDFEADGAYALYNWELFFHAPLLIATRLTKNQRFAEAKTWLEYIFNPTVDTDSGEAAPARFWNVVKLKKTAQENIDRMLWLLSSKDSDLNSADLKEKQNLKQQYQELNAHPFQPHLIAGSCTLTLRLIPPIQNPIQWPPMTPS